MKSTGIVRKVDELGRIVLPIELRRTLDIKERDSLEIFVLSLVKPQTAHHKQLYSNYLQNKNQSPQNENSIGCD